MYRTKSARIFAGAAAHKGTDIKLIILLYIDKIFTSFVYSSKIMSNSKPVREANTILLQQPSTIFKEKPSFQKQKPAHHFLWQDKRALDRARHASPQPAPDKKVMRSQTTNNKNTRSQNDSTPKRQTVQVTLWVKPIVKAELERLALQNGLTVSSAGAALLERALQANVDMKYGAFLEPIVERAISRKLDARDARLISLLVRIAFDSGQTRSIVTNILGLQPDITPELLRDIIQESDKRAKSNITRRTPQITDLIEALEKWFFEADRKEN